MKILYAATDQDLASFHGGTVHLMAVVQELLRRGHEVHLLIQKNARTISIPEGIVVHEITRMHRFKLWTAGSQIQKLLSDLNPDLVMERYYNFAGEAVIRAKALGIPTVLEVNSPMIEYPGSLKSKVDLFLFGALKKRRERIASAASLIISPMKEIVPEQYRNKVKEIEWGADSKLFDPDSVPDQAILRSQLNFNSDEILLIHFGSLRKWHGLVKLLEAFDSARPKFITKVRMIIIGPKSENLQDQRRPDVKFVGSVPHKDLPVWLKIGDLAVFPFAIEQHRYLELGFYWSPLKVFEAMSMRLPVLTLNHQRLRTLLGTEDPDFFYDGTTQDLSDKIVFAVERLSLLKEKSTAFRQRILNHYSWNVHGETLHRWLVDVAGKA